MHSGGRGDVHAALVFALFEDVLGHGDVREGDEAEEERGEGDGLVEELDGRVVLLLERRDARVRLCSIGLQRVISVGCLVEQTGYTHIVP